MKRNLQSILLLTLFVLSTAFSVLAQDRKVDPGLFKDLKYRNVGPSRGGRATTVTGIASQPGTFYMGATGGGVWKTTNYGQSWNNVSDGYFATGSIGAIQVADSDPNIVYVGTGSDGIRSNVITGKGVYKSINAGRTWSFVGLKDTGQIGAVEVHPRNPNIVFVAAIGQAFGDNEDRGVYRSKDGGSTWNKVFYVSDKTGAVDLEFAPDNPDIVYAGMWHGQRHPWTIISGNKEGGLFKSTDGGDNWKQLKNGLPQGIFGKSDFAVSVADPSRVYALIEAPVGEGGLYRSNDYGENWELISTERYILDRPFYYNNVDADPNDADVVYVNSTGYFKSTNAGKSWQRRSTPHGDNHDMWINPNDSNLFVQCNDGGANVTRDGGRTWSSINNQLTAELYQVAVDDQFPYWLYAGQQDNSTIMVPSIPPYNPSIGPSGFWQAIGGCETGPAVPKPGNHNIVYANCKGRFGVYNKLTGQEKQYYVGATNIYSHNPKDLKYRFQRVSPIHVSPHDPDIIYHGSQYLHKTTDDGVTWETISPDLTAFEPDKQVISGSPITRDITGEEYYSTIYAVQESPLEKGVIWVGANDGPVHVTRDAGKTWMNVTPGDLPKGGRVQTIEPSPHRPEKAYFATYRYLLNDWQPYIYKTEDYGKSWTRLTTGRNGIPEDFPTRVIREDPDVEGLLYAGTEFGMFISFNDGGNWQEFQQNLPVTPITDIKLYRNDLVMSTMGRSFWIMDNITPLHQIAEMGGNKSTVLLNPETAYRMRYRGSRGGAGEPEYPSPAAEIDYYVGENFNGELMIEIYNEEDELIRKFSSKRGGGTLDIPADIGMHEFDMTAAGGPVINKTPGMNRFRWDMQHAPAFNPNSRRGGSGPMVIPGKYKVRFISGYANDDKWLEIKADPRVLENGTTLNDMKAQEDLCLKVRDLITNAVTTSVQLRNSGKKGNKVDELMARFFTEDGRYMKNMLLDQLGYLNSMLNRADQKPGRDAYIRYEELKAEFEDIQTEMKKIIK